MFSVKLLKAMNARGINQKQLSAQIGMKESDLSKVLTNKKVVKLETISAIAKILNVPECYFFDTSSACCGIVTNSKNLFLLPSLTMEIKVDNLVNKTFMYNAIFTEDTTFQFFHHLINEGVDDLTVVFQMLRGRAEIQIDGKHRILNPGAVQVFEPEHNKCKVSATFSIGARLKCVMLGNYFPVRERLMEFLQMRDHREDHPVQRPDFVSHIY